MQLKMIVLVGQMPLEHSTIYQAADTWELKAWWVTRKKCLLIMWWVQPTGQARALTNCSPGSSNAHVLQTMEGHIMNKSCLNLRITFASASLNVSPVALHYYFRWKQFLNLNFLIIVSFWILGCWDYCFNPPKSYSFWRSTCQKFVFIWDPVLKYSMLFVINTTSIFREISFLHFRNSRIILKKENNRKTHCCAIFKLFSFIF